MNFDLNHSVQLLSHTPKTIENLLVDLPPQWINFSENPDSWSAYDIVGHLIHGEKTDWIPRTQIIMNLHPEGRFEEFDRFAQFENSKGKSIEDLLKEFKLLRLSNIEQLKSLKLTPEDYDKTGIHPEFGTVTLAQLLATWTAHDLSHINQMTRVLSRYYHQDIGPWKHYLPLLNL